MTSANELLASQKMLALLEEANNNAEALLDGFPSAFALITADAKIIRANQAYCDLLQKPVNKVLHGDFYSLFGSENATIAKHNVQKLGAMHNEAQQPVSVQFRADVTDKSRKKSQQFIWTVAVVAQQNNNDQFIMAVIGKDCSSIYESEVKLTSIFESLPLGIVMLDKHGFIEEVLTEYTHVLLENQDLQGASIPEIVTLANDQDAEDLLVSFRRMLSSVGKPMASFMELDPYYKKSFGIRSVALCSTKWLKASYQAVTKNNVVDKFMVILQDDTENIKVANDRKRINELERQSRELYECAIRDPLTGLYTRLYMDDGFSTLLNGFKFGNINAIELVIFDIDDFKRINDTYGHIMGDEVISKIGRIILSHCHAGNIAVRYGGDEFLVMLPEEYAGNKLGSIFAEAVRAEVEALPLEHNGAAVQATVSSGVINCKKGETIPELVERVDQYLYKAKESGKNVVKSESEC